MTSFFPVAARLRRSSHAPSYLIGLLLASLFLACLLLPLAALSQPSQVRDHARISQNYGLFPADLELSVGFGASVANIGDVDGDGITDLAVGEPTFPNDIGAVYILFLKDDGTIRDYRRITAGENGFAPNADELQPGVDQATAAFGSALASLGDLDGDGISELAVGASGERRDGNNNIFGAIYILFLEADGTVRTYESLQYDAILLGSFGAVLAGVGDLNGDGTPDLGVGTSFNEGTDDYDTAVFFLDENGTAIGHQGLNTIPGFRDPDSLAPIGDVDGDGVGDLLAGATLAGVNCDFNCQGLAYIAFMNSDGTVRETQPLGPGREGYPLDYLSGDFGDAVAGIGDFDGDNVPDVLIGASGENGAVHLVTLQSDGTTKDVRSYTYPNLFNETLEQVSQLGRALAPLGDLDGDGTLDFAAGARYDGGDGELDLFLLDEDGDVAHRQRITQDVHENAIYALLDLEDGDLFGGAAVTIGDVDGDGTDDVAVGARGTGDTGGVWILFMRDDGTVREANLIDDSGKLEGLLSANDRFGDAVAAPGDLNGDGVPDLLVGAPRDDDGASDAGAVWILYLTDEGVVDTTDKISATSGGFKGDLESDAAFGSAIAVLDDINGDGSIEIAVGANETGGLEGDLWLLFLDSNNAVESHRRIDDKEADLAVTIEFGDKFGSALAVLPDLDGNGVQDLAVGAEGVGAVNQGAVHILFLEKDGRVLNHTTIGEGEGGFSESLDNDANFGTSLAVLNPDDRAVQQLAVGASGQGGGGTVWLLTLDKEGQVEETHTLSEAEGQFRGDLGSNDNFGAAVAALGDLDGDSVPDLLVGASADDEGGSNRGAAWVLFMDDLVDPPTMHTLTITAQDTTGNALAVPISLTPVDEQGVGSGGAPFTVTYRENTLVQLYAPESFEGFEFQGWAFIPARTVGSGNLVFMDDDRTAIAVYGPGDVFDITLTVASSNPDSGVEIDLSIVGRDFSDERATTPASLTYTNVDEVRAVAPLTAGDSGFSHWLLGDTLATENRIFTSTYNADATLTAVYERAGFTLTVASEGVDSGVPISVSPADADGEADGATPFERFYPPLTTVTLTAPEAANGQVFLHWRVGNLVVPDLRTLEDTWTSDLTVTAVFEADDGGEDVGCPWTATPTNASGVFLGQATVEGVPGSEGDCVVALDADGNVAGASQLIVNEGLAYINLPLYGDDAATEVDEGLTPGEAFTLYLYDSSERDTLQHEQTFTCWEDTNGAPIEGCGDVGTTYDFTAEIVVTQTVALKAGWNLMTPTVVADATTPATFFEDLTGGELLTVTGSECGAGSQFYDPSLPDFLNTLETVEPGQGYWVRVDQDAKVEREGVALATDFSQDLCAGWNLIGYWPTTRASTTDAFAGLLRAGTLEVVTGFDPVAGAQFYDPTLPDFLNTLDVVEPGRGYWVRMSKEASGFQYPVKRASKHDVPKPSPQAEPVPVTRTNAFMFVHGQVSDGGGVIEVVAESGQVVGAAHVRSNGTFGAVAVYGDDPRTEALEGAQAGERLRLRHEGRSYRTEVVFQPDMRLRKARLTPEVQGGDLPLDFMLEGNYPNPFNPTTTLRYGLPEATPVRVEVFNTLGQRVAVLVDAAQQAGWHTVMFDAADLASGLYLYRLQAGTFQQTRQMLLVK